MREQSGTIVNKHRERKGIKLSTETGPTHRWWTAIVYHVIRRKKCVGFIYIIVCEGELVLHIIVCVRVSWFYLALRVRVIWFYLSVV